MTIQTKIANAANYKAANRTPSDIGYIVIHYTGNQGDTAKNNADYFARESGLEASAHYFVDESSVWQSVLDKDVAWHCGAKKYIHPSCRNANSIGVEICMLDKSGNVRQGSVDNAIKLVRELMAKYSITITNIIRHNDVTGKDCPAPMVSNPQFWAAFKADLIKEDDNMTKEQFQEMYNQVNPLYTDINQVPDYWRSEVEEMIQCGAIKGDGKNKIAMRYEALQAAIVAYRSAGIAPVPKKL